MTRFRNALLIAALCPIAGQAFGQASSPQAAPLPVQHIVFVIDNSSSMAQNDNMGLRGVAACLMLDAVELSSDVEAGVVKFNDAITTDGQLHPPNAIRESLQAGHLGSAEGGTNMQDALSRAIGMLSAPAHKKRIVLITDGQPSGGTTEEQFILNNLVPNARQAGIEIFALGLTNSVNPQFLEQVTTPTGGRSQVSQNQTRLLEAAKALVGHLDSVYNIAETHLDPSQSTFEFEVHPGTDRARVTVMLDHPTEFSDGEIVFTLNGSSGDGRNYWVRAGSDRIAAWTSFFSAPGEYTLKVTTNKPGVASHLGLKLIAEALSNVRLTLTAVPQPQRYMFGTTVAVDAEVVTGQGRAQPGTFQLSGVLKMLSGATQPLTFDGARTTFTVPDVPGRHIVEVRAESPPVAQATAQLVYEAVEVPIDFRSSRDRIDFTQPIGPATKPSVEDFTLSATVPQGVRRPPVFFSFTVTQPVGIVELMRQGGGVLQYGTTQYPIPAEGLKLQLRIRMDPTRPVKREKVTGSLQITSNAGSRTILYTISVMEPEFKLRDKIDGFSLWWDPYRPRVVKLGRLRIDASEKSTFSAIVPESIADPVTHNKIADVALRIGDQTPNAESDNGRLRYSDIELPPGKEGVPILLVITPNVHTSWEDWPRSVVPIPITFVSSYGVSEQVTPNFHKTSVSTWPVFGRMNYGRDWMPILAWLAGIMVLFLFLTSKWPEMRAFRPFEAGSQLMLRLSGPIRIADVDDSSAALVLPNSGSAVDDREVGKVIEDAEGQRIESEGLLITSAETLVPGDSMTVVAPDPANSGEPPETVWEMSYYGFVPGEGGTIAITSAPRHWTVFRVFKWVVVMVVALTILLHFIGTEKAAEWAYARLTWLESMFYL